MKKTVFKNELFYRSLTGLIALLLIYNSWILFKSFKIYNIVPIFIDITILILIMTKSRFVKIGIFIWSTISLVIGFGFEALAILLDKLNNWSDKLNLDSLIFNTLGFLIGVLIIIYTSETVAVVESTENLDNNEE